MTVSCDLILFHDFLPKAIGSGIHALDSNVVKMALVTTVPILQTDDTLSDLTQVANGNGYTTGGVACTVTPPTHLGGIYRWVVTSIPTITASGAGFSHKGVVFYNDTATNKNLIGASFSSGPGLRAITNVAQSGTAATLTLAGHGWANGDVVVHDALPFPRLNGTFTISNVTTNTYQITAPASATITSQAVTSGRAIRPDNVTTGSGVTYTVTAPTPDGLLAIGPRGVLA